MSEVCASNCPLCGRPNECQLCTAAAYKGPCWCATVMIPEELIARVPAERRTEACICRNCVMEFQRAKAHGRPGPKIRPGDFYFEHGVMVFTAAYHRCRGYCCGNHCRHCPYTREQQISVRLK
ncbi:MAG: cysteine-rich CWC family protein [Verrucomicrobiae bacterium]|nr:cysteine-rich CWC family protein [Verrucomicrobiae bacterium]